MNTQVETLADLFGLDDETLDEQHAKTLHNTDAMAKVRHSLAAAPSILQNYATESVARSVKATLDVPLTDILAAAWNTRRDLLQYCDRTKYPAGEVNDYVLLEHEINSVHHPKLQLMLDNVAIEPEIEFEIALSLTIDSAVLQIQNARIVGATAGTCQGKGTVKCEGAILIEQSTREFKLPGKISFGEGIEIGKPYRSKPDKPQR